MGVIPSGKMQQSVQLAVMVVISYNTASATIQLRNLVV